MANFRYVVRSKAGKTVCESTTRAEAEREAKKCRGTVHDVGPPIDTGAGVWGRALDAHRAMMAAAAARGMSASAPAMLSWARELADLERAAAEEPTRNPTVGGKTNDALKKRIAAYGVRSVCYWDPHTKTVKKGGGWQFATVAELKDTLRLLEFHGLPGGLAPKAKNPATARNPSGFVAIFGGQIVGAGATRTQALAEPKEYGGGKAAPGTRTFPAASEVMAAIRDERMIPWVLRAGKVVAVKARNPSSGARARPAARNPKKPRPAVAPGGFGKRKPAIVYV